MWETSFSELHNKGNLVLFHYSLLTLCLTAVAGRCGPYTSEEQSCRVTHAGCTLAQKWAQHHCCKIMGEISVGLPSLLVLQALCSWISK